MRGTHMLRSRIIAGAVATSVGLHKKLYNLETLDTKSEVPPVFVVRHAESVANFTQHSCIKKSEDAIQEVVARLLKQEAKVGDTQWEAGCAEIKRAVNGSHYWWRRWLLDDSHLPPDRRERDAALTDKGIASTLERADTLLQELPTEGPRRVLLIVSPMTRAMMTAALLFHRFFEAGIHIDLVLEPGIQESLFWPYDIMNCIGRKPEEAIREVEQLLAHAPSGVAVIITKLKEAAKSCPTTWWQRGSVYEQPNKLTVRWEWGEDVIDMQFVREHREGILHSIRQHVVGRRSDYCAAYVVCHGMTIAKIFGDPSERIDFSKIPANLECRRMEHIT